MSNKSDVKQPGLLVAGVFEASLKDDIASMEHPVFAMKAGDKEIRTYRRGDEHLRVTPSVLGRATIYDKDIWLYLLSLLIDRRNRGEPVERTIRFAAHEFLTATGRGTSGIAYQRLKQSLRRLQGTMLETNIKTGGVTQATAFGLIDGWSMIDSTGEQIQQPVTDTESSGTPPLSPSVAIEVTLSDWTIRAVCNAEVLTIPYDYFALRSPLERRLFELVRKHCGEQEVWRCSTEVLHQKTGSKSELRRFRQLLKKIAQRDELPSYSIQFDGDKDLLVARSIPE